MYIHMIRNDDTLAQSVAAEHLRTAIHRTAYVAPRLTLAFRALRDQGYIARQKFLCCSSCAGAALSGYTQDMRPKRAAKLAGGVFYHRQDAKALENELFKHMEIRYGRIGVTNDDHTTTWYGKTNQEVGQDVAAALRAQDLCVEWTGDPDRTITVAGITQAIVDAAAASARLGGDWRDILVPATRYHHQPPRKRQVRS